MGLKESRGCCGLRPQDAAAQENVMTGARPSLFCLVANLPPSNQCCEAAALGAALWKTTTRASGRTPTKSVEAKAAAEVMLWTITE
jgi:hypothetical protein